MPNIYTWFGKTVEASIKAGGLQGGKRLKAVFRFFKGGKTVEQRELMEEHLAPMEPVFIWAPILSISGLAYTNNHADGQAMIYLSPLLEFEPMPYVVHTVAHEFAHISLGHHRGEGSIPQNTKDMQHHERPCEIETNELVARWGFPDGKPKFMKRLVKSYAKELGTRNFNMLVEGWK